MRRIINKRLGVVAGIAAALLLAGGAFAYFTSTGSGSGQATVGTSTPVAISSTSSGELVPGGEVPLTITITNNGSGTENVTSVTAASITTNQSQCESSWFEVEPIPVGTELAAGKKTTANGHLKMINATESQDACEGATVTVQYASN